MKKIAFILSTIVVVASCGNKDAKMVKKYLEENDDLFAKPKVEIVSCENLGMQFCPFDELMSIILNKSEVYDDGQQKLTDAVSIRNRTNRRKAILDVMQTLETEYNNPSLKDVVNAISMPERSAVLYPDRLNRIAIKASYKVEGTPGEEIFYLLPDQNVIKGTTAHCREAYDSATKMNNLIYRLILEAEEWIEY